MAAANTTSFNYDDRGNSTSDGAVSYGYNAYNLLTSAGTATLTYDASNRLAGLAKSGTTTQFLYDGNDLIAEYNGTTLLRRYLHGPGTDNPLVWFEGADDLTPHYLTADQQGSITAVTDASGNALAINSYDPYGVPQTTNAVYQSRFGYTGQVWLPEVGLYYYKARMYAPSLGRFLQPDPIGYGGGMNMYAYVGGDPINYTDPWGLMEDCPASKPTCTITVTGPPSCRPSDTFCMSQLQNIIDSGGGGPPTHAGGGGGGAADQPTVVVVTAKKKEKSPTCQPSLSELQNSGEVSFVYFEASVAAGLTAGDIYGTFYSSGGYSGKFHTSYEGLYVGAGFSVGTGSGVSKNLATFKGVNYNVVANLLVLAISDNFDPNNGEHVGETNGVAALAVGLGGTRSVTEFLSIQCPGKS